ncbi:MAG: glycosyltransferase family A protein [Hespellia sp.]|nr:glycosyltransferase family A protein [Hespellia sp.]
MKKILTVTIPSYNVEQYLNQTLDSFIEESIMEDIEVLIVDDGSKDTTAAIGREYESRYPGTFRVISKENGGHGSTINRGAAEASGTYFKVVDGDDWVNTKDFAALVQALKTCDADYVLTNYYEVNDQTGELTEKEFKRLKKGEMPPNVYLSFEEVAAKMQIPMHALVIKTSILKDNQIRLDEHCFYVDVEYVLYPIPYVEKIAYFDLYVYMYRLAVTTQSVSIQGFQKHIQNHIDVIYHLTEFFEKYAATGVDPVKASYIGKRIAQMVGDQVTIFMSYGAGSKWAKEEFIMFDQKLKGISSKIYELSGEESGALRMLRKTGFMGYGLIVKASMKRNNVE